jgi:hypothetical protein
MGQPRFRLGLLWLSLAVLPLFPFLPCAGSHRDAGTPGDERARAIQAVSRLTFGARLGDIERVLAIGVDKWVAQQRSFSRTA